MLDRFNRRTILELADSKGPCVSLLLHTAHTGRDRMEARIRLRNEIAVAEDRLAERGMRRTLAKDLLEPARRLEEDADFWMNQEEGLALYVAQGAFKAFRLPSPVKDLTIVADVFQLRPLLALFAEDEFYVLALDQESSRLVHVRDHTPKEVSVPDMPDNLRAVTGVEEHEKQRQFHNAGHVGRAGSGITHGAGDHADRKDQILRYCQAVDKAVSKRLARSSAPLVLAADEPIADIYPRVSHYRHLQPTEIHGSPARISDQELATKGATLVQPNTSLKRKVALSRYAELAGSQFASERMESILPASREGNVDVLFAENSCYLWGSISEDLGSMRWQEEQTADSEDLINRAAVNAFRNGGVFIECTPGELSRGSFAAIFRH